MDGGRNARDCAMRINTNIMAMNTHRMYGIINQNIARSIQRLSTGLRINSAADDPAGLAISEKMRAQIRGMRMASKNCQDAMSLIQTAEGSMQSASDILHRMREIAIQASSDTYETSIDRAALNIEYQQLMKEINDIAGKSVFNEMPLMDGSKSSVLTGFGTISSDIYARFMPGPDMADGNYSLNITDDGSGNALFTLTDSVGNSHTATVKFGSRPYDKNNPITFDIGGNTVSFKLEKDLTISNLSKMQAAIGDMNIHYERRGLTIQSGPNQGDELRISIGAISTNILGISNTNVATGESARNAISLLDRAINTVSSERATLGAMYNRLEFKINNLETSILNLSEAESRIRDVDYALEMADLVKYQIQLQANIAMMAQANSIPQMLLQLLNA